MFVLALLLSARSADPLEVIPRCQWGDDILVDPSTWEVTPIGTSETRARWKTDWTSVDRKRHVRGDWLVDTKSCQAVGVVRDGVPGSAVSTGKRPVRLGDPVASSGPKFDMQYPPNAEQLGGFVSYAATNPEHVFGAAVPVPVTMTSKPGGTVAYFVGTADLSLALAGKPRPKGTTWRNTAPDTYEVVDASAYQLVVRLAAGPLQLWLYDVPTTKYGGALVLYDAAKGRHGLAWRGDADAFPLESDYEARGSQAGRAAVQATTTAIRPVHGRLWFRIQGAGTGASELVGIAPDGSGMVHVRFTPQAGTDAIRIERVEEDAVTVSPVSYGPVTDQPRYRITWEQLGL
jgi:hypothetical protein